MGEYADYFEELTYQGWRPVKKNRQYQYGEGRKPSTFGPAAPFEKCSGKNFAVITPEPNRTFVTSKEQAVIRARELLGSNEEEREFLIIQVVGVVKVRRELPKAVVETASLRPKKSRVKK